MRQHADPRIHGGVAGLVLAAVGGLVPTVPAQGGAVVVPHWDHVKDPEYPTYEHPNQNFAPRAHLAPTHQQFAYDVNELKIASGQLTAVAFRHATARLWTFAQTQAKMTVSLWHAPFAPLGLQSRFAANVGSDRTQVFSGVVSWPRRVWSDPLTFDVRVAFQRPFAFDRSKGQSLVMDTRSEVSTLRKQEWWACGSALPDYGFGYHQPLRTAWPCWESPTGGYRKVTKQLYYPGGRIHGFWTELPPSSLCFESYGPSGYGAKWLGMTLPIALPSRGCYWGAASVAFFPFRTDVYGTGYPAIVAIPSRMPPGTRVYEQSGCFTPGYNSINFVTLASVFYVIGTGHKPNCSWALAVRDSPPAQYGAVKHHWAVMARFEYR